MDEHHAEALHPQTPPERLSTLALCSLDLAQLVVQNPSAPGALLRQLWDRHNIPALREAIAAHPALPPSMLNRAARSFPAAFLQNPCLPLWELEQPMSVWRSLQERALLAILPQPAVPHPWVEALLERCTELARWRAAAANPSLPEALYQKLASAFWRLPLKEGEGRDQPRPRIAPAVALALSASLPNRPPEQASFAAAVLVQAQVSREEAPALLTCPYPEVHMRLLGWTALTAQELSLRASVALLESNKEALARLASNPNTPPELLLHLWKATEPKRKHGYHAEQWSQVWAPLASHPNTPAEVLSALALYATRWVAKALLARPQLSPTLARTLAQHRDNGVRHFAIRHPESAASLTKATLTKVNHNAPEVRRWLLQHPHCPPAILAEIAAARRASDEEKRLVAKHPRTPPETLWMLRESKAANTRYLLARHPNASRDLLRVLAQDQSPRVRASANYALSQHDHT